MFQAIANGDIETVDRLLKKGAQLDATNDYDMTALHVAVSKNNVDLARHLLDNDAYVNALTWDRDTPLHVAASICSLPMTELLVERAVRGMIPHNRLGRQIFKKLKIYTGAEHPHDAQQVKAFEI
jgi:ankyrin repeat protein